MTSRIIVIDDHQLFREGVKRILEFEESFEVIAEGDDGKEAFKLIKDHRPDAVLMDINMPNMNGIEATKNLISHYPETKVIILSIHDDQAFVTQALKTGATGYLLKEMDSDELIEAISVVLNGGSYIHPKVTHKLVADYRRLANEQNIGNGYEQSKIRRPIHLLTRRECEVLQLLADGKSNRSIGEKLYISEKTVKNHVSSILQKTGADDRTQAVVTAIKNGWVEIK